MYKWSFTRKFNISEIGNNSCIIFDCSNNFKSKQKKIINKTGECVDSCNNSIEYKYEYNGRCYNNCSNGFFLDENNNLVCKCKLDQCLTCPKISLNKSLCIKCNDNYYQKENDPDNIGEYINCYESIKGYYLDKNNSIFRKCYETCEECDIDGNNITHNCLKCKNNFFIEMKIDRYKNCYKCDYYYYFDHENKFHCTKNLSSGVEYPILISDKSEYIKDYFNKEKLNENIQNILINKTKENELYDEVLQYIRTSFISENYDTSDLDNGKDEIVFKTEKMTVIITSVENQKNNINNNMTKIDMGECELILRNFYNISINETIYIIKLDISQDEANIPKIEYDFYSRLSGNYLRKLDKSKCDKISLLIPIELSGNLDELNTSSGYFNDICYIATSDSGTDILLKDRQKNFVENNKMVCQEDCDFVAYNKENMMANCSCEVKETSSSFKDMKINKTQIYNCFVDFKNIANIKMLSCYQNLFNITGLLKNFGSYIILFIFLFHIMSILAFFLNQFEKLKNQITKLIFGINYFKLRKFDTNQKGKIEADKINVKKSGNKNFNSKDKILKSKKPPIKSKKLLKNLNKNSKSKNKNKNNNEMKNGNRTYININNNKNLNIKNNINNYNIGNNRGTLPLNNLRTNNIRFKKGKKNIKNKESELKEAKNIMKYNDDEINVSSYEYALQYDKRQYLDYYFSLVKTKHDLIYTFFNHNDYNSVVIKIDLFFVGFSIYYTTNALFFDDDTMHNIYENKGSFDILYQLPKIIYSSLISIALNFPLKFLALPNGSIIDFKRDEKIEDIQMGGKKLIKTILVKIICYFIISFIFLAFFWYYIAMFGAVYKNTQIHLLKDTLISFGLSLLYPFCIYLLPGFFRIPALSAPNKNRKCLYSFSKLLQML